MCRPAVEPGGHNRAEPFGVDIGAVGVGEVGGMLSHGFHEKVQFDIVERFPSHLCVDLLGGDRHGAPGRGRSGNLVVQPFPGDWR